MRVLLDTQLLVWTATRQERLTSTARDIIEDPANTVAFSVVSVWEIAIKRSMNRPDFNVDPETVRRDLIANGYTELQVTGDHAVAVGTLPWVHKDPFDRLLLAQAREEGLTLLTTDGLLSRYPGDIRRV